MKKRSLLFPAFLSVFLACALTASAQSIKTITLKDGSVLKGKVIDLTDGVYTIETSNLGSLQIAESEILGITVADSTVAPQGQDAAADLQKANLKQKVQEAQGAILTDGDVLMDINNLVSDEEIKAILSDPKLLNEVMSYDQTTIEQSEGVQKLMSNPKMQQLMEKIKAKYPQP